jgi:fructose-1,6-bisphosphatase/inositol monophosphatase family enzyme
LALVDPLDGSHIAARGYPLCSISVSIVDLANGRPAASQIVEVFTGRLFTAYGTTALQDGQMIQPSSVRSVSDAMVVSYLASPSRLKRMATDIDKWSKFRLLLNYGGMLDIAKVGSGNCDAMVEATMGMVAREYIGGIHIATAAGAVASTLAGAPVPVLLDRDSKSDFVVSATPQLHEEILSLWR